MGFTVLDVLVTLQKASETWGGFFSKAPPAQQGAKFHVGELAGDPLELKNGDVLELGDVAEADGAGAPGVWDHKDL